MAPWLSHEQHDSSGGQLIKLSQVIVFDLISDTYHVTFDAGASGCLSQGLLSCSLRCLTCAYNTKQLLGVFTKGDHKEALWCDTTEH